MVHPMNVASPSPEAPRTRREEAKALFRRAILDAAEQVFADKGFHVARIQDVAKHARIGVGTVYNHFEQKEDLLRALLEERTEGMLARLAPQPSDPAPFEQKLTARLTRMLGYVEEHRSFFLLAVEYGVFMKGAAPGCAPMTCGPRMQQVERFRAAFRALVEEGLAAGALVPMDVQRLVWALGGLFRMFTFGTLMDQPAASLTPLAPVIADLFLNGVGRKPPAPRARRTTKKTTRPARRTDR
jgi:AcrR family transcriptional regulator